MTVIIIRSIIIYLFVVLSVRIMGKRQIGELKPHELVITILISAVATIPLQEISIPLTNSIFPIMIFVSLEIIGSALSMKSIKLRNLLQGKPMFIIKDGILQQKQMRRLRFTMDDIIDALRQAGVFDRSDKSRVRTADARCTRFGGRKSANADYDSYGFKTGDGIFRRGKNQRKRNRCFNFVNKREH